MKQEEWGLYILDEKGLPMRTDNTAESGEQPDIKSHNRVAIFKKLRNTKRCTCQ